MLSFWSRLKVIPFESGVAVIIMVSAGLALAKYGGVQTDALSQALPWILLTITQVFYFLAGLGITLGIGFGHGKMETFGLVLLLAGLLVRTAGTLYVIGFHQSTATSLLFNFVFALSCVIRLKTIRRGAILAQVEP